MPPKRFQDPFAPKPASAVADGHTVPAVTPKFDKKKLAENWRALTGRTMDWLLEGRRLEALLAEQRLKDIGILLGIGTEKVLLMEGQPTQIIGQPQQAKLDQLGQALQAALKQRGIVQLTERTATVHINEPRSA